MKIEYDTAHDLLNIEFRADVPIDDSLEVDGVVIDYAKDKRIVAIEVLDASKRTTRKPVDLIDLAIVKSSGVRERDPEGHSRRCCEWRLRLYGRLSAQPWARRQVSSYYQQDSFWSSAGVRRRNCS